MWLVYNCRMDHRDGVSVEAHGALSGYLEVSGPEPQAVGDEIGEAWGTELARSRGDDKERGLAGLVEMLSELGFRPEVFVGAGETELRRHSCLFLEVATENPRLVCSAHLGLLRGALSEAGVPIDAARLDPLVEPSLCIAHLQTVNNPSGR
jgi:predicted ArsR family transcriptional regulator